jgi:hypothetical protein
MRIDGGAMMGKTPWRGVATPLISPSGEYISGILKRSVWQKRAVTHIPACGTIDPLMTD